jgi:nitrite reductase/ring-hydroxylating ferredoxin subunit
MKRRDFLLRGAGLAAAGVCGCLAGCSGGAPAGAAGAVSPAAAAPVDVGPLASFRADGVNAAWAESHQFFLVRSGERLYACSSICTHRRAVLEPEGTALVCPRHGSRFDVRGEPVKGPASTPLPRLAIRVDERGHVIVDPSRRFDEAHWGDANASVTLPA